MRSNRGQALVEFALVLPVLLLLLFGIVDFGRIYFSYLDIQQAARETARYAVVHINDINVDVQGEIEQRAIDTSNGLLTVSNIKNDLSITPDPSGTHNQGDDLKIQITYPESFITPLVNQFVGPFQVTSQTIMRIEK